MKIALSLLFYIWLAILAATAVQPVGSGTQGDPYQITDLDNLQWLSETSTAWSAYYVQTADVDASETSTWNSGEGWIPIGNSTTYFTGNYDGQGHSITGLYINRPTSEYQSLFGITNYAVVNNLNMVNAELYAYNCGAALIGYAMHSNINGCHSSGSIYSYVSAGGLFGSLIGNTTASECSSEANVSGGFYVGGLIGNSGSNSIISKSYACGSISGIQFVGGLTGYSYGSDYSNCYATGNVLDGISAGGLIGGLGETDCSYCYATGPVTTDDSPSGGLIGLLQTNNSINSCFWDMQTTGQSTSAGGTGCTTAQMQAQTTYTDSTWDFVNETVNGTNDYWAMESYNHNGYPYLSWQVLPAIISISTDQLGFDGVYPGQAPPTQTVTIYCEDDGGLVITEMSFADGSQGFSVVEPAVPCYVSSYDSLVVTVAFAPDTTGNRSDTLHIVSNAMNAGTVSVTLSGLGVSAEPSAPQNVQVQTQGNDVVLSWDVVTTNVDGESITPTGYIVLYSEVVEASTDDYFYLTFTTEPSYTHLHVLLYSSNMFYRVLAVIEADTTRLPQVDESEQPVRWGVLKQQISR